MIEFERVESFRTLISDLKVARKWKQKTSMAGEGLSVSVSWKWNSEQTLAQVQCFLEIRYGLQLNHCLNVSLKDNNW